jgi:GNAT superfamily N-acetyltransferase
MGIIIAPYYWIQEGLPDVTYPELQDPLEGFSFEAFGQNEIKAIAASKAWNYSEGELLSWLNKGKKCIGAKYQGEIAAFMWIDCDECNWQNIKFRLKENEAYLFDMFTMKPFRGKGIAPYLRYQSYKMLRAMGRDTMYSYSDYLNIPSINFKKKLNAQFLKVGLYIEFFKKYHWNVILKTYPAGNVYRSNHDAASNVKQS